MSRASGRRLLAATVVAVTLSIAAASEAQATHGPPDRVCGTVPGDGAYNYVKVWNMTCRYARRVNRRAARRFCGYQFQECDAMPGEFDTGYVRSHGFTCFMRVGYESYSARCHKEGKHFVARAGA